MADVHAAGGVVVRSDGSQRRYLVVHRPRYDDWSLPKGKLDDAESYAAAAVREVAEETGVRARLVRPLSPVEYRVRSSGRTKCVRYWLMVCDDPDAATPCEDEVDEVRWVRRREGRELLSYPHDVELLDEAHDVCRDVDVDVAPVLVTRHALAGNRSRWTGDDAARPLSSRGVRQAEEMAEQLRGYAPRRLVSSPFVRCVQTLEPLGRVLGLDVVTDERLAEGTDPDTVRALVHESLGTGTVLCSHGDVIGDLVGGMRARGTVMDSDDRWPKGSTWLVAGRDGRLARALRVAPPARAPLRP